MANITGWGRGTFGQGAWNEPIGVNVGGQQITSGLGTLTINADANITVTGFSITSALGTPPLPQTLT